MTDTQQKRAIQETTPAREVELARALARVTVLHPADDWHDDDSDVLWWRVSAERGGIEEPPFCGSPLGSDWPYRDESDGDGNFGVLDNGDTLVWSRLPVVKLPAVPPDRRRR